MMKLPEKLSLPERFQFRHNSNPGFTHSAELENGVVTVKWARGWNEDVLRRTGDPVTLNKFLQTFVEGAVQDQEWNIVVEEKKVEQELPEESLSAKASPQLPSVFYFCCNEGSTIYKASRTGTTFDVTWDEMIIPTPVYYSEEQLLSRFKSGDWKIINHKPPTPEQLRSNEEFREQIAALDHSIRLNKLDIEHKEILIKSYEARKAELQSKLVEES